MLTKHLVHSARRKTLVLRWKINYLSKRCGVSFPLGSDAKVYHANVSYFGYHKHNRKTEKMIYNVVLQLNVMFSVIYGSQCFTLSKLVDSFLCFNIDKGLNVSHKRIYQLFCELNSFTKFFNLPGKSYHKLIINWPIRYSFPLSRRQALLKRPK